MSRNSVNSHLGRVITIWRTGREFWSLCDKTACVVLYLLQNVAICAAGCREYPSFAGRRYGDPSKRQIARGAYVARAVRKGVTAHPGNLYPTMRFTSYTKMSDADIDPLYAYMMAMPPVTQEAPIRYRTQRCARPFTKTRKEPCDFPPPPLRVCALALRVLTFGSATLAQEMTLDPVAAAEIQGDSTDARLAQNTCLQCHSMGVGPDLRL